MTAYSPAQVDELLASGPGGKIHLIGAGGCGMSGLAHLLLDSGYQVSGSDLQVNLEVRELQARGANIHQGHAAENLPDKPLLVVYSSAVRLHNPENPELQLARARQVPIVRRAVLLSALLRRQSGICVAGMHGKTTTTALLTFALENLKANPSYAIGALVPQLRRHARFSAGERLFVIEADESDGTLREFEPDYAILLNIDEEHMDFYASLEAIGSAFRQFAAQTRKTVVFCADDPGLTEILAGHPHAISYGFSPRADYCLVSKPGSGNRTTLGEITNCFEVWKGNEKLGDFSLALMGEQNVSNAGAVVALLHHLGYDSGKIAAAIGSFHGAARRQQELFRDERFSVFDDYGHHPAEIEATLKAFKRLGVQRLLVAFQPHRFTRTQLLLKQFSTCFKQADRLWITEIYAASEPGIAGIDGALLAKAVRAEGQPVEFIASLDELRRAVRAAMQPGDAVLFLGAGDITKAAHELAAQMQKEKATTELTPRIGHRPSCGCSVQM